MPSLPKEIWKAIPGYDGQYEASSLGRIRSVDWLQEYFVNGKLRQRATRGKILATSICKGYVATSIKDKTKRVHHLVMLAFVGPMPAGKQVNHKDGNKANNRRNNLEYETPNGNLLHAVRLGLKKGQRGEKSHLAKLTEKQVREIRRLYATRQFTLSKLGRLYQVHYSTISNVISGKRWRHTH